MDEDLPKEFDLIVIGTGFPDSCIAAAASRVGKTVLHIDPNEYYGGPWASFNLDAYNALLSECGDKSAEIRNAKYEWHIPLEGEPDSNDATEKENQADDEKIEDVKADDENVEKQWNVAEVMKLSRKFNFDLCPKILYSSGSLVQLLISSNICRYAEFRAVDRICTYLEGNFLSVPCSRSDVFNTKDLNIVEKRQLMKMLSVCMAYGEDKCDEDNFELRGTRFIDYLRKQKVTEKINKCVMQAIAMANEDTQFEEGMERIKKFLHSLGRYGNTPFIFPMYGSGEIPQCFCRLCAVFGGIYCLKRQITSIDVNADEATVTIDVDGKQKIKAKHVVCSGSNLPLHMREENAKTYLSRGIFLASSPLGNENINNGGGGVNLLRLTTADGKGEAIMLQLAHQSGTCPKGLYLFHFTTAALSDNPELDLKAFTQQVFTEDPESPKILYSSYFSICGYEMKNSSSSSSIIHATAGPFYELDYDHSIDNARSIFTKIYSNEAEFLPRAPDPEEIVIDGEDPKALSEQHLPEDLRQQLHELQKFTEQMEIEEAETAEINTDVVVEAMDS